MRATVGRKRTDGFRAVIGKDIRLAGFPCIDRHVCRLTARAISNIDFAGPNAIIVGQGRVQMGGRIRRQSILVATLITTAMAVPTFAQASRAGALPSFSQDQASSGGQVYVDHCAGCHGAELEGVGTPALTGASFLRRWTAGNKTVGDLYTKIHDTMPLGAARSVSDNDYEHVTAFILSRAGYQPGPVALATPTMKTILSPPGGA
jgi:mono/diheme cytochrome c family protein